MRSLRSFQSSTIITGFKSRYLNPVDVHHILDGNFQLSLYLTAYSHAVAFSEQHFECRRAVEDVAPGSGVKCIGFIESAGAVTLFKTALPGFHDPSAFPLSVLAMRSSSLYLHTLTPRCFHIAEATWCVCVDKK